MRNLISIYPELFELYKRLHIQYYDMNKTKTIIITLMCLSTNLLLQAQYQFKYDSFIKEINDTIHHFKILYPVPITDSNYQYWSINYDLKDGIMIEDNSYKNKHVPKKFKLYSKYGAMSIEIYDMNLNLKKVYLYENSLKILFEFNKTIVINTFDEKSMQIISKETHGNWAYIRPRLVAVLDYENAKIKRMNDYMEISEDPYTEHQQILQIDSLYWDFDSKLSWE